MIDESTRKTRHHALIRLEILGQYCLEFLLHFKSRLTLTDIEHSTGFYFTVFVTNLRTFRENWKRVSSLGVLKMILYHDLPVL